MAMENQDCTQYLGTDFELVFSDIKDTVNGRLIDPGSVEAVSWAMGYFEESGEAIVQKTLDVDATMTEPGRITIRVRPEDTENLEPGFYSHELRIKNIGRIITLSRGKILFKYKIADFLEVQ